MVFLLLLDSSSKKKLPTQSGTVQQKNTARSGPNNTTDVENSQGQDDADHNEQDDALMNDDDDDDLDITEIDHALLGGKTPLSVQTRQENDSKVMNNKSTKSEQMPTSQRYSCLSSNETSILNDDKKLYICQFLGGWEFASQFASQWGLLSNSCVTNVPFFAIGIVQVLWCKLLTFDRLKNTVISIFKKYLLYSSNKINEKKYTV